MKDFVSKIEDFFFDLLGLVLPGIVFISLITAPLLLFDYASVDSAHLEGSKILTILTNLSKHVNIFISNPSSSILLFGILISYIVGHVLKVLAIIQYEFLSAFFDNFLNILLLKTYDLARKPFSCLRRKLFKKIPDWLSKLKKDLLKPLKNTFWKLFSFKSPDYMKENESLRNESITIINKKYNTKFPQEWYSLYKLSTVIANQENIKSLAQLFMAKYNFYRSMAFSFSILFFYYLVFFASTHNYLSKSIIELKVMLLSTIVLLWFTFHVKYKRYWTLCGNETLVSLYYFLIKDEGGQNTFH